MLGTSGLGEADLIVSLLAEHHGLVRGVAASARKSLRRFGGSLEPLTRVTAAWTERDGRELHRIESLEAQRSFAEMQADPGRQAACAVLCEITAAVTREDQPEPKTFRLLGAVLEALEGGLHPWIAVRYAEFWTLQLHGVLPDLAACAACGEPFPGEAIRVVAPGTGLLCRRCPKPPGAIALTADEHRVLRAFEANPPASVVAPLPAVRPGGALEALLRGGLEAFAERSFRTYRHLRAATSPGAPTA